MIAIIFMIGTKYACNLGKKGSKYDCNDYHDVDINVISAPNRTIYDCNPNQLGPNMIAMSKSVLIT